MESTFNEDTHADAVEREVRLLQRLSGRILVNGQMDDLYRDLLETALQFMDSKRGTIQLYVPEKRALKLLVYEGFDPDSARLWEWVEAGQGSTCGVAFADQTRMVVSDVEQAEFLSGTGDLDAYRLSGIRAFQSTPLISRSGRILGMISNHWTECHMPSARQFALLDVIARQTADLLDRNAGELAIREREARQEFILRLSDSIRHLRKPEDIQRVALELLRKEVNGSRAILAESFDGSGKMCVVAESRAEGLMPMDGLVVDFADFTPNALGEAMSGRPLWRKDILVDEHTSAQREEYATLGTRAWLMIPLISDGRLIAELTVHSAEPRSWSADEILMVQETTERLWSALERARVEVLLRRHQAGYMIKLEREVAERMAELEKSRDQLRSILDTTLVQMSILQAVRDKDGAIADLKILEVNKELEKATGRTDLIGKLYASEYPGIREVGLFKMIVDAIETGEAQSTEYFYSHEGFKHWFACMFVKLNDGVVATNMDISSRKHAEERLRKLESEKQREIFEISLNALEQERTRISESLHNGIAQMLYGIKIGIDALNPNLTYLEHESRRSDVMDMLGTVITEIRQISHELMPTILNEFGLKAALDDICRKLSGETEFKCKLRGTGERLGKHLELAVYRTIQELTNNVVKHAAAKFCEVTVIIRPNEIRLCVRDNGKGMTDGSTGHKGIGLASIRSKVKLLNGSLLIESAENRGTCIDIIIPQVVRDLK